MAETEDTNIRVAVRCRPFNTKEKNNGEVSCARITGKQVVLINPAANGEEHSFAFDVIIDDKWTQESVWQSMGVPILQKAFSGFNATIFAYGQTGSGKTWSMQGADGELQGIIPRMSINLFARIENDKKAMPTMQFLVTTSYFEIYNEVIFDLLDPSDRRKKPGGSKGLEIKEHPVLGVYVKGLQEIVVDSASKLQSIIDQGMKSRTVASTQMNADSSRSHSVFVIKIHQKDLEDETKNVFAKVNLVDLAGSERVKSTGASGATLKEGANINKSLSALGNVINALVEAGKGKNTFIPYRNSKLTRVLQESLGGNSITAMLAAMSPAACNFDETLSTLKYANRAKAIKVKAVKNEEASQVSRLNEEIRLLKEKLMSQNTGAGGGGMNMEGSFVNDEKHQQQLRELEGAIKDTWEEKAKLSQAHEAERQKLLLDQQTAERELEFAREQNWKLLEEKGDPEITIAHVKELARTSGKKAAGGGGGERGGIGGIGGGSTAAAGGAAVAAAGTANALFEQLTDWGASLKDIAKLEQTLTEHDTIVQVYKSSIDTDRASLMKQFSTSSSASIYFDTTTMGLMKQFRDKFGTVAKEIAQWAQIQDNLDHRQNTFAALISSYLSSGNLRGVVRAQAQVPRSASLDPGSVDADDAAAAEGITAVPETVEIDGAAAAAVGQLSESEYQEILRGLKMIRRQIAQRQRRQMDSTASSRGNFINFSEAGHNFIELIRKYEAAVIASQTAISLSPRGGDYASNGGVGEGAVPSPLGEELLLELKMSVSVVEAATQSMKRKASIGGSTDSTKIAAAALTRAATASADGSAETPVQNALVLTLGSAVGGFAESRAGVDEWLPAASVEIHGGRSWTCPYPEGGGSGELLMKLLEQTDLSSIEIQGGDIMVAHAVTTEARTRSEVDHELPDPPIPAAAPTLLVSVDDVTLPCGVSLARCNDSVEQTAAALGDVLSWQIMLKKNPPEKFLKRPPVRFLFDLIKFIGMNNEGFLPDDLSNGSSTASWEVVGKDKPSKLQYMQRVVDLVMEKVSRKDGSDSSTPPEPPTTTALAIVTGADADLTNKLLQQLAVAVYCHQQQQQSEQSSTAAATGGSEPFSATATATILPQVTLTKECSWPITVAVSFSVDGSAWSPAAILDTGLTDHESVSKISLATALPSAEDGKPLRTKYLKIQVVDWSGKPRKMGASMRVRAHCLSADDADAAIGESAANQRGRVITKEDILEILAKLSRTLEMLGKAAQFLAANDERLKALKQEEVKKNMDLLAKEKAALEKLLESEKQSLTNDKQDLADQLTKCFAQLRETKSLFEREQELNNQLQASRSQIEAERNAVQAILRSKEEENASLKSEILRLQANSERDRTLIESLQVREREKDRAIEVFKAQIEDTETRVSGLEQEKEDYLSQIVVLTEERDTSRAHEEDLFEKLMDRTNDLDRLQESYVDIAERCNDARDEAADLREKLEYLQEAFTRKKAFVDESTASLSSSSSPAAPPPVSTATAVSPSVAAASPVAPAPESEPASAPSHSPAAPAVALCPDRQASVLDGASVYAEENFEDYEDEFEDY